MQTELEAQAWPASCWTGKHKAKLNRQKPCFGAFPQTQRQVDELEAQAAQISEVSEEAVEQYHQLRQVRRHFCRPIGPWIVALSRIAGFWCLAGISPPCHDKT